MPGCDDVEHEGFPPHVQTDEASQLSLKRQNPLNSVLADGSFIFSHLQLCTFIHRMSKGPISLSLWRCVQDTKHHLCGSECWTICVYFPPNSQRVYRLASNRQIDSHCGSVSVCLCSAQPLTKLRTHQKLLSLLCYFPPISSFLLSSMFFINALNPSLNVPQFNYKARTCLKNPAEHGNFANLDRSI